MTKGFELRLLGNMSLIDPGGTPVEVPLRKGRALLAILALDAGRRHARERIAALLWGDRGDEQARRSLSQGLFALRRAFGDDADAVLAADAREIWLNPSALEIDVVALRTLAADIDTAAPEAASTLCGSDLLEDFVLKEAGFNDWLDEERQAVRRLQTELLAGLARRCLDDGDAEAAAMLADRLVGIDPLDEAAQRLLMRAHAGAGRRSAALAAYRACMEVLERELGVEPEAATMALFEEIKAPGATPATAAPTTAASTGAADQDPAHILVVDDDPLIRELFDEYLTAQSYRVSTADGGAAMRRVIEGDSVDLIILDLGMPGEHGFTLVSEIRKSSDVGIIIMTGSQSEVDQIVGLELGADDYVSKSSDHRELLARVRSVLRRVRPTARGG